MTSKTMQNSKINALITGVLSCLLYSSSPAEELGKKELTEFSKNAVELSFNNIANINNSSIKPTVIIDEKNITEQSIVKAITDSARNQAADEDSKKTKDDEETKHIWEENPSPQVIAHEKNTINNCSFKGERAGADLLNIPEQHQTADRVFCKDLSKKQSTTPQATNKPITKNTKNKSVREISFADNEQINVVLSNKDINRVLVKGDKIQSVNGSSGLYVAKNDTAGSAYISVYVDTPFTIFASTEKGHNFSLLVTPSAVTGRTIVLNPTTPPSVLPLSANKPAEAESYQKALVELIKIMVNNEAVENYARIEVKKAYKIKFYNVAEIQQIASYSGSSLIGTVATIKNKSSKPLVLKAPYFYKPRVRAVAISQQIINPKATGLLYQVITKE